jgi:predicted nucleotidyltransferase
VLQAYRVGRASVFGSVVRGEDRPDSDLDLLVEMPAGASLLDLAGLKLDLEKLLGREVDVVTFRSLNPLLRERILSEQQAIL